MSYIIETPVYINTKFLGFCDHCKMSKLALKSDAKYYTYYDNRTQEQKEISSTAYTLTCERYEVCKQLADNLRYQNGEACAEVKIK